MTKLQRLTVTPAQICPPHILLTAEQQHYLLRVLRLGVGDRFIAMDGQQHWWLAQVEAQTAEATTARITARILEPLTIHTELPIAIVLLAALPKGNGFDEVVRQTTEIGVSEIVPILSDRTLLHPSPQKLDRWRRIAQEAAEQSERLVIPTIVDPLSFPDALLHPPPSIYRYICITEQPAPHLINQLWAAGEHGGWGGGEMERWGDGEQPGETSVPAPHPPLPSTQSEGQRTTDNGQKTNFTLITGPEGGWTDQELEQAIAAGFQPISLGKRILRAVTAPVVALGLIAATLERREFE